MTMIKHRIDQYMGKIQFRSLLLPTQEPNQTKLISFNLEPILDWSVYFLKKWQSKNQFKFTLDD